MEKTKESRTILGICTICKKPVEVLSGYTTDGDIIEHHKCIEQHPNLSKFK